MSGWIECQWNNDGNRNYRCRKCYKYVGFIISTYRDNLCHDYYTAGVHIAGICYGFEIIWTYNQYTNICLYWSGFRKL